MALKSATSNREYWAVDAVEFRLHWGTRPGGTVAAVASDARLDFAAFKDVGDVTTSLCPFDAVLDRNLVHEVVRIGKRSEFEVGEPRPSHANV